MNKNDIFIVDITDLTNEGEGVGKGDDGFTFFIHGAIPGDRVKASVTKMKKTYGYARIVEILEPSKDRVEPMCPVAGKCGGCSLLHMSYESELRFKENKVKAAIERIGGFEEGSFDIEPIIGFPRIEHLNALHQEEAFQKNSDVKIDVTRPTHYRNKAQFPVGRDSDGKLVTGFFAGRSHRIIPVDDCMIEHEVTGEILRCVKSYMMKNHVTAYDEASGKGLIRHIMVRVGFATGEVGVCLVINGDNIPAKEELVNAIKDAVFEFSIEVVFTDNLNVKNELSLKSLSLNINKENTNVIMGHKLITIFGNNYITDEINGIKFHISPMSFYQVNHTGVEKLYGKALEFAGLSGEETVWDLYCGIGTISLFLAKKAKKVYGVEIVPEAIENAKENANLNGIENADFYVGAAETLALSLPKPDVIVVDPPRKGCDEKLLETMLKYMPEKIVYVSCDPATLARDLKILCENSTYKLKKVQPVDMFSGSCHVETVCLLSKGDVKSQKLRVEFSLEDMDTDGFKKGATYNAIRDWIKEKYGYRVTNLNIAQVKQKHGIIERENYNKPKSPESKQPGCPEEKVKAIEDAMRHFHML